MESHSTEEIVFIRRSQAARLAGVSDKTISRWCEGGKLKFKRDESGRYLIDKSSIDGIEPDEMEDTRSNEDRIVAHATMLLGQSYSHIEKKESQIKALCDYVTNLHSSRDQHTIDALTRTSQENATLHRELEKLRRELANLEREAAADAFDTDAHVRNEDRKDNLVGAVIGAIQDKLGTGKASKDVVDAVRDAMKQE